MTTAKTPADTTPANTAYEFYETEIGAARTVFVLVLLGSAAAVGYFVYENHVASQEGERCSRTSECEGGEYCVEGRCKARCTADAHCLSAQETCGQDGKCAPKEPQVECKTDEDCGNLLLKCNNNTCMRIQCLHSGNCPGYSYCDLQNQCVEVASMRTGLYIFIGVAVGLLCLSILFVVFKYVLRWASFKMGSVLFTFLLGLILLVVALTVLRTNVVPFVRYQIYNLVLTAAITLLLAAFLLFFPVYFSETVHMGYAVEDYEAIKINPNEAVKEAFKNGQFYKFYGEGEFAKKVNLKADMKMHELIHAILEQEKKKKWWFQRLRPKAHEFHYRHADAFSRIEASRGFNL